MKRLLKVQGREKFNMEGSFDSMSEMSKEAAMELEMMHRFLCGGWRLGTVDENVPGSSTSEITHAPPFFFPFPESVCGNSTVRQSHFSDQQEIETRLRGYHPSSSLKITEQAKTESTNKEVSETVRQSSQFQKFLAEGGERGRWCIGQRAGFGLSLSLKDRLAQVIGSLREHTDDRDFLIQIWVPVMRKGKQVLTTVEQPYSFNTKHSNLASYRDVSKSYNFAAEEDSEEFFGLPGRVFLGKLPEWTPDVRFFESYEYPRINYAQQYDVHGSLALPIFGQRSRTCLGVVEIVTTSQMIDYRLELECVCKALEAVDLTSSRNATPPSVKVHNKPFQVALPGIRQVLESICRSHRLPIALTWAPCARQGKHGIRHFDENSSRCISTVDSACFVSDGDSRRFLDACSDLHLLLGEGIVGRVFARKKPYLAIDVTALSITDYPLSQHAESFGLRAAFGVPLRSIHTGLIEIVLELFFPKECFQPEDQRRILGSLTSMMQQCFRSSVLVMDGEQEIELILPLGDERNREFRSSILKESSMTASPGKGKGPSPLSGYQKQKSFEGVETTDQWSRQPPPPPPPLGLELFQQNYEAKDAVDVSDGSNSTGVRRPAGRRRTKAEKTISLQLLQRYFAGSLKDAAKSIGVCPTTLKRICRQHGITRWPSRKIKKVGHSLRKLQQVIDSVQGAEGTIKLSSFHKSFPHLSSPNLSSPSPSLKSSEHLTPPDSGFFSHGALASKSLTSSCSHSSGSSQCCSIGTEMNAVTVNPSSSHKAFPERAGGHAELPVRTGQEEAVPALAGSQDQKAFFSPETALPPLPETRPKKPRTNGTIKVKAIYGETKFSFVIQERCGFVKLKQEIGRRIKVEDMSKFELKYLDDDWEWVLLTCNADLEECIDICRSLPCHTIQISIHPSPRSTGNHS